jgi:long-chain acyl-CoA synthetase
MESKPWFKNWPPNVPKIIAYPEASLGDILRRSAQRHGGDVAISFLGKRIIYEELNELTDRFATALHSLGVMKGDRVALFMPNIPQYIMAYYGSLKIGAVNTAISPLYKERELEHQLNDSGAETLVFLDTLYPVVKAVKDKTKLKNLIVASVGEYLPSAKRVIGSLIGRVPKLKVPREPNVYYFKEFVEKHPPQPPKVKINTKEDLAALQYTGGTTGVPKASMLTHFNLVSNAVACAHWLCGKEPKEAEDVFLTVLPLFHIFLMTTGMNAPIYLAGKIVMLPLPVAVDIFKAIQNERVTVFCGVPTLYATLNNRPDANNYNLKSIKFCISGAAPLPSEVQKKWMELTGGVLVEGYGLTESSPVTHCNPLDKTLKTVKVGSIGLPFPDTDSKIVDVKTGEKELPQGKTGELVVTGPQIMKGYWNMPEETAAVLRNGWLYTGDIGKMDEDGYFFITDRKKDLIKYKGWSVYPREIEDVIYEHPAVKLAAVVGKPDPEAGQIPKAYVVLKEGAAATQEDIINFVKGKLASYKVVREVEFRKELPMTLVGKVLRRTLREEEKEEQQPKPEEKPTS